MAEASLGLVTDLYALTMSALALDTRGGYAVTRSSTLEDRQRATVEATRRRERLDNA